MTFRDLCIAVIRRWYVVVAALLAAAALAVAFGQGGGVYSTKAVVTFTLPATSALTPDNGAQDVSVIAFAGAVAAEINEGKPTPRYSSGEAPFYGAGVREGVLVSLRDDGSQWAPNFGSAVLEIQIVGLSEVSVARQQASILAEIDDLVAAQLGVSPASDERIAAHVEPLTTRISHITPSQTARVAAIAALSIAALLVGGWAAVVIDRFFRRGVRRRDEHHIVKGVTA